jgi:hypothetical protein
MNIYEAMDYINSIKVSDLPYGDITSITYGNKIVNGVETDEPCIVFGVLEKKPLSAIPTEAVVPKSLDINNYQVKTDVVQRPLRTRLIGGSCNSEDPTIDPVKQNYLRRRPLQGGASSIYINGTDATLGLFVRDKSDGQVVALSNSHVYAASNLLGVYQHFNDAGFNNIISLSARQPGTPPSNPYGNTNPVVDCIGSCKRTAPIGDLDYTFYYTGANFYINGTSTDAAIVKLPSYNLIDSSSVNVIGFNVNGPYSFATDAEITSLGDIASPNYGAPVFRSGRTLGPVGYPGSSTSCYLSVVPGSFGLALVGTYSEFGSYFYNTFDIRGNVAATKGGDSGSALFALFNPQSTTLSAWKCIGLVFAGISDAVYTGTGTRITTVAEKLNIVPWNGNIPTFTSETETLYLSAQNYLPWNTSSSVILSGRRYYQTGGLTAPSVSSFTIDSTPRYWSDVANNGTTWLAVASGVNTVFKSTSNGEPGTWGPTTSLPAIMSGGRIGYGNRKYIAYGDGAWVVFDGFAGIFSDLCARSVDDGVTWTAIPVSAAFAADEVKYINNKFVAFSVSQSAIQTSDNGGLNWDKIKLPEVPPFDGTSPSYYYGIAGNGNTWIAVSRYRQTGVNYSVGAKSTDNGVTWTSYQMPKNTGGFYDIEYGNGVWVAIPFTYFTDVNSLSCIVSTNNGVSWETINYAYYRPYLSRIRFNNNKFYQLRDGSIGITSEYMCVLDSTQPTKWSFVGAPKSDYYVKPSVNNIGTVISVAENSTTGLIYQ